MMEPYNEQQTRQLLAVFYNRYIQSVPVRYFLRMDEVCKALSMREDEYGEYTKFGLSESDFLFLVEAGASPVGREIPDGSERLRLLKEHYREGGYFHINLTGEDSDAVDRVMILDAKNQTISQALFKNLYRKHDGLIRKIEFYVGQYASAARPLPYDTFKIFFRKADANSIYELLVSFSPHLTGLLPPFCHRNDIDGKLSVGEYAYLAQKDFSEETALAMVAFMGGIRFLENDPKRYLSLEEMRVKYASGASDADGIQAFVNNSFHSICERLARFV